MRRINNLSKLRIIPRIRNLQKEDAPKVAPLIKDLTKNIVNPDQLVKRLESLCFPQNWQYLVVEDERDGTITGFGGLAWYSIPSKGLVGWSEEIVVDKNYRGQGISRLIKKALIKLGKQLGLNQIKLIVDAENEAAIHVYESFGYFERKNQKYYVKKMV